MDLIKRLSKTQPELNSRLRDIHSERVHSFIEKAQSYLFGTVSKNKRGNKYHDERGRFTVKTSGDGGLAIEQRPRRLKKGERKRYRLTVNSLTPDNLPDEIKKTKHPKIKFLKTLAFAAATATVGIAGLNFYKRYAKAQGDKVSIADTTGIITPDGTLNLHPQVPPNMTDTLPTAIGKGFPKTTVTYRGSINARKPGEPDTAVDAAGMPSAKYTKHYRDLDLTAGGGTSRPTRNRQPFADDIYHLRPDEQPREEPYGSRTRTVDVEKRFPAAVSMNIDAGGKAVKDLDLSIFPDEVTIQAALEHLRVNPGISAVSHQLVPGLTATYTKGEAGQEAGQEADWSGEGKSELYRTLWSYHISNTEAEQQHAKDRRAIATRHSQAMEDFYKRSVQLGQQNSAEADRIARAHKGRMQAITAKVEIHDTVKDVLESARKRAALQATGGSLVHVSVLRGEIKRARAAIDDLDEFLTADPEKFVKTFLPKAARKPEEFAKMVDAVKIKQQEMNDNEFTQLTQYIDSLEGQIRWTNETVQHMDRDLYAIRDFVDSDPQELTEFKHGTYGKKPTKNPDDLAERIVETHTDMFNLRPASVEALYQKELREWAGRYLNTKEAQKRAAEMYQDRLEAYKFLSQYSDNPRVEHPEVVLIRESPRVDEEIERIVKTRPSLRERILRIREDRELIRKKQEELDDKEWAEFAGGLSQEELVAKLRPQMEVIPDLSSISNTHPAGDAHSSSATGNKKRRGRKASNNSSSSSNKRRDEERRLKREMLRQQREQENWRAEREHVERDDYDDSDPDAYYSAMDDREEREERRRRRPKHRPKHRR